MWIVQHDESAHNTVLGVFASLDEADAFATAVRSRFADGVIYSEFALGYRYDGGASRYEANPGPE